MDSKSLMYGISILFYGVVLGVTLGMGLLRLSKHGLHNIDQEPYTKMQRRR